MPFDQAAGKRVVQIRLAGKAGLLHRLNGIDHAGRSGPKPDLA